MSSKGKILVVDDDRLVLATLTHGLSAAGYAVVDADNGDDAILEARTRRPDLALLDIRMEGKSGFDVAAYLREHGSVPFMFLSAFSDAATVAQVRALGALDHLINRSTCGRSCRRSRRRSSASAAGSNRSPKSARRVRAIRCPIRWPSRSAW
ncbi:Alkaline phosphatase synthesis transcriptional regulatory protein PhoP [Methylibium sp. T29-B]|uniref:response regulator n=1 Tax=Methylibium sp. T29-B TaxID=1437443 RepID=UPI0003F45077|nr:response regulator [Methylibium sp. T29-B]EWS61914.1 Alkaline phosphatase synthesis transcriptional regulatory protein PhoP [Methylibium sp. T29-B]